MMSLKEAARAIGVPYHSVWYHYKEGRLPVHKIVGRLLIDPEVLREALAELGYRPRRKRGVQVQ
jgi:molybdenum-dependent DNA-binding transcriptional regulator ModE